MPQWLENAEADAPEDRAENKACLAEQLGGLGVPNSTLAKDPTHRLPELLLALLGDAECNDRARRDFGPPTWKSS